MATMNDLPLITLPVPIALMRNGRWINNGPLSNMNPGQAVIRFRSVASHYVEPAYVAAKAPDAMVPQADARLPAVPFHERVATTEPRQAKTLGKPIARGGLVEPRPDWECVCIGAMASFLAQKFAAGTREATWLVAQDPDSLHEWSNWRDARWGLSFQDGDATGTGRDALGLLLRIGRTRLVAGKNLPTAPEEKWADLQASLIAEMVRLSSGSHRNPVD